MDVFGEVHIKSKKRTPGGHCCWGQAIQVSCLDSNSERMLLLCWTEMQLGLTVAQQKNNSDSDVVQSWTKFKIYWCFMKIIILFLIPHGNTTSPKYIDTIMNFVWSNRSMTFDLLSCQSCIATEFVELHCLLNFIQKFDSVLLPCFYQTPEFSSPTEAHLNWA